MFELSLLCSKLRLYSFHPSLAQLKSKLAHLFPCIYLIFCSLFREWHILVVNSAVTVLRKHRSQLHQKLEEGQTAQRTLWQVHPRSPQVCLWMALSHPFHEYLQIPLCKDLAVYGLLGSLTFFCQHIVKILVV